MIDSQILVVGLDGATLDLIGPYMDESELPNLAELRTTGSYSKLISTILPLSPTAWTSFGTGKGAGKHGIYDFSKRMENSYGYIPTFSTDIKAATIWDIVGSLGGKSVVVNVPLTYPPKPINGAMISGFPTPTARGDYTYPANLLSELRKEFGEVRIHKPAVLYRKGREREISDELIKITKQQTEITKYLMRTVDWNLTVSVYDATDVLGHYFWAYLDPNHPKHDKKLAGEVANLVKEIHVELDRAIGELFKAASNKSLKIVLSDHGFGPVYYGVYVNNWLVENKYMNFKRSPKVRVKYWAFKRGLHTYNLLQFAKKLHLVKSIESAYSARSASLRLLKAISLTLDDIDWAKTKVYSAGNFGQLYLNLKGREPSGIVTQEESKSLIETLMNDLNQIKDPESRRPMFDHIFSKLDVFQGRANSIAPDIVFFDSEMKYAAHRMFELGSNRLVSLHPVYSGHHKMDGILFMTGEGVKKGYRPGGMEPNIVDLAPTILHQLSIPAPSDTDGRLLVDFFDVDSDFARRAFQRSKDGEKSNVAETKRILLSLKSLQTSRVL